MNSIVLTVVVATEQDVGRHTVLSEHVMQVAADARRTVGNPKDLAEIERRAARFSAIRSAKLPGSSFPAALLGLNTNA